MPTDTSSRLLATKIAEFCRKRLTPYLHADTERIQAYLLGLISRREYPPTRGRGIDWRSIAYDCGIDHPRLAAIKEEVRPALDAIVRAFDAMATREAKPHFAFHEKSNVAVGRTKPANPLRLTEGRARLQPDLFATNDPDEGKGRLQQGRKRGVQPKAVVEFPQALDDRWEDPGTFREALTLHMQRHDETYWHLHRAIVDAGESFDIKTIRSWLQGTRSPASADSMAVLRRIERRYRLPEGYFRAKLPHQSRAARGHELEDISPSERRRLAWHLPDNFNSLPHEEREKIVEWVKRVIISGATDYRRFLAAAAKQRLNPRCRPRRSNRKARTASAAPRG